MTFHFKEGDTATPAQFITLCHDLMGRDWVVGDKTYNLFALGWTFKTNNTKGAIGMCQIHRRRGQVISKTILISKFFYRANLTNGKLHRMEDTIRHEIAHALDYEYNKRRLDHGPLWVEMCAITGADPTFIKDDIDHSLSKYTLSCTSCGWEKPLHRIPKYESSCPKCSGGRYNKEFKNILVQNY